jgi:hypothetical protein
VTALVTTPNVDRSEEIVSPRGVRQAAAGFHGNPIFCAGHTYSGKAGEPTVIGHWTEMRITEEGMFGTAVFARTPLAEQD